MFNEHLPYLRFKNPSGKIGGRIFDDSEACEYSFVSRDSRIAGQSSVWESYIEDSNIVRSTVIKSKIIASDVIETLVSGAHIEDSLIQCEAVIGNVKIENSDVLGKSRVAHDAVIKNCRIKNLTVKGSAQLIDWNNETIFDGCFGYVNRGVWYKPPRVFQISDRITVTESIKGFVFVHCREYEISHLLKIGNRLGKSQNWTKEEILGVRKILHHLSKS